MKDIFFLCAVQRLVLFSSARKTLWTGLIVNVCVLCLLCVNAWWAYSKVQKTLLVSPTRMRVSYERNCCTTRRWINSFGEQGSSPREKTFLVFTDHGKQTTPTKVLHLRSVRCPKQKSCSSIQSIQSDKEFRSPTATKILVARVWFFTEEASRHNAVSCRRQRKYITWCHKIWREVNFCHDKQGAPLRQKSKNAKFFCSSRSVVIWLEAR